MNQTKLTEQENIRAIISEKFIEPGFEYWFTNHEHVRSPFPPDIRLELKDRTSSLLFEWIDELDDKYLEGMKEEEFVEMFETILFNEAIKLVESEDQRFTIMYPFMPRLGDQVNHKKYGEGNIVGRQEIVSDENKKYFKLAVQSRLTGENWETKFVLPG